MTKLNNETRELTTSELDAVSGGLSLGELIGIGKLIVAESAGGFVHDAATKAKAAM